MGLKRTSLATMVDINGIGQSNSRRFPKNYSVGASSNGKIDGASVCVCVCVCVCLCEQECVCVCVCLCEQGSYFEGAYVIFAEYPIITIQYHHSRNFLIAHSSIQNTCSGTIIWMTQILINRQLDDNSTTAKLLTEL
jgi:hypothetical protein